jgi:membrane-associated phospholipid phosphatase
LGREGKNAAAYRGRRNAEAYRGRGAGLRERIRAIDAALTAPLVLPQSPRAARIAALGLAHSGDMPLWIVLLGAAWLLGDETWKLRALVTFAGLALVEVVVIGVKWMVRRRRPAGTDGMIYRKTDPYSFPSGHAARAVLLSLLAYRLGPLPAFIVIVAWSPFMVISRIAIGIHYALDVVAGAALGALLTALVLQGAAMVGARL